MVTNPDWARRPTDDDIRQYYPDRATRTETSGSATLSCTVRANGTLEDCTIVSETPADYGFGGAALKLARIYRMRPKTADGASVEGGTVRVPITFKFSL
jgi:protein TonB